MRIQHNIMAMSAYRNYTNNVSAMKKNLEKLSSGYKINRAGDDAAGLAISEKMRAQITGLETAQKNAKDGISLVQTAEGALTEVHDMLNRMVELATQSANGTYDDTTDRWQMQKEINQLREEINRIADSSNFNGINLLDGKLGLNEDAFTITTEAYQEQQDVTGVFGDPPAAGDTKITNTILHTASTAGVVGSFTLDLSQIKVAAGTATDLAKVQVRLGDLTLSAALTDGGTTMDGKDIAAALVKTGGDLSKGIFIRGADGTLSIGKAAADALTGDAYYSVTDNADGTITFTLKSIATSAAALVTIAANNTDDLAKLSALGSAADAAHKLNFDVSVTKVVGGDITGTENVAATNITATQRAKAGKLANFVVDFDISKLEDGMKLKVGNKEVTIALGKDSANKTGTYVDLTDYEKADLTAGNKAAILDKLTAGLTGNGYFTVGQSAGNKLTFSELADGSGKSMVATDAMKEELMDLDKIKALFSAEKPAANAKTKIQITAGSLKEGNALTIGDKKYVFTKDTTQTAPANTVYVDIKNAATDLKSKLDTAGLNVAINSNTLTITAAASTDASPLVLGKGLTLQIGDTADSFNQLNVTVRDMHCDSLGIDSGVMSIADQEDAAKAVDKIKAAINTVSDVRGTLGATQNRLEHTINNLSVMTENIQDAESTIRDVDVAEEMMAYTKNNILIQSAQAMLAQANQVPQGVLQLLG